MKKTLLSIACLFGSLFTNAQTGAALSFSGANDYVQINDPNFGTSDFTLEAWIKPTTTAGAYLISTRSFEMGASGNWFAFGYNNNKIGLEMADAGLVYSYFETPGTPVNIGSWNHVALTRSGANFSIYVNGVLEARYADSGIRNFSTGSGNLRLSGWPDVGVAFFNGSMDEVRFWNTARTQCDVISYMNCEIPTTEIGLVGNYHFNQGVNGAANSSENALIDYSGNGRTGTLINFSLSGLTSNWIAPGGVTSGNVTPSVCTMASALNFDGANDYVSTNIDADIDAMPITSWEAWVYPTDGGFAGDKMIISMEDGGWDRFVAIRNGSFFLGHTANGWFTNVSVDMNQWQHIAVVYSGSNIKFYKNGVEYVFGSSEGGHTSTGLFTIGANQFGTQNFMGSIDEVRVWNVARTRCEIVSYRNCEIPSISAGLVGNYQFNQGVAMMSNPLITNLTDASGNSNNGTLNNFALTGTTSNWIAPGAVVSGFITPTVCPVAAALDFDGSNDDVRATGFPNFTEYTIEGWFNLNSLVDQNLIVGTGNGNPNTWFTNQLQLNGGKFTHYLYDGAVQIVTSPITPVTGVWYHVAIVAKNGTPVSIYVNGIPSVSTSNIGSMSGANEYRMAGTANGILVSFNGQMDEVRIWNAARSQCEINTYMNCEIPTSMTGLLANYHFNQGLSGYSNPTETTLIDATGNGYNGTLNGFGLTSTTSNWIAPGGVISGYTTTLAPPVISVSSGAICAGQSFTMVPSGAMTYTFSNGSAIVTPTADATYSVSGTDVNGCASNVDAISSVTVNALPVISVNSGSICAGQSFTMVPTGADSYTYSNGSDIVMPTADATYTVTGTNTLTTCNATIESTVTVALPTLTVNSGTICAGNSFTITPSGADTYIYSNGSNVVMPTGDATYTVTGTNTLTTCSATIESTVTVNALPTLTVNSGAICTGQSFTLVPTGADSYTYSSGSDVVNPTIDATYTVTGTNTLTTCSAIVESTITVNALPTISVNSGAICAGQSFTMIPTGADSYTYSSGSDVVNPTIDASYTVTGTNTLTTCSATVESTITVNSLPTISVNSGFICAGQSFTLIPTGADSYTYSNGSDVVNPTVDATYTVTGTNTLTACAATIESTVTVNALPTIMAMTSNTLLCAGETATLTVTGSATSYTWSNNENTTDIVVNPTITITYMVDGTDANGCVNSTTILQDVNACTGIVSISGNTTSINVYPNPNNGLFTVDLNTTSQVSITNTLGQVILTETMSAGKQNLNIQNQSTGIYFVKVIQQDKQHIIKLIKK